MDVVLVKAEIEGKVDGCGYGGQRASLDGGTNELG